MERLLRSRLRRRDYRRPAPIVGVSWRVARNIMGEDFFGLSEVGRAFFGIKFLGKKRRVFDFVPLTKDALEGLKGKYILTVGIGWNKAGPLAVSNLIRMFPSFFEKKNEFRICQFLTRSTLELGWYLVSRNVLEDSREKTFQEQQKLLNSNEYRGNVIIYAFLMCMMLKIRGQRLFNGDCVWCEDLVGKNDRAFIGFSKNQVIKIDYISQNFGFPKLCLAPVLKLQS